MRFGISFANTGPFSSPEGAAELARTAEEAGFESLWPVEHVVVPAGYESAYPYSSTGKMAGGIDDFPIPDPLIWLAFVAGVTSRIKLATGILILPQRNPLVLAKAAASLDHLSEGRFLLGVGTGWLEEEFTALGVPFHDRGDRTDDYIRALRAAWSPLASYQGTHTEFSDVFVRPLPVNGSVPIVIGGHTLRAARRAGELGDGFFPARGSPDTLGRLWQRVRETAEQSERDPDSIELTVGSRPDPESVSERIEAGADRVVFAVGSAETVATLGDELLPEFA